MRAVLPRKADYSLNRITQRLQVNRATIGAPVPRDTPQSFCCVADMKRLRHELGGFLRIASIANSGTG